MMHSKRKAFVDLSNVSSEDECTLLNSKRTCVVDMLPIKNDKENTIPQNLLDDRFQNVHPLLPWYKFDLHTVHMNYEGVMKLTDPNNGEQ